MQYVGRFFGLLRRLRGEGESGHNNDVGWHHADAPRCLLKVVSDCSRGAANRTSRANRSDSSLHHPQGALRVVSP